MIVFAITLSHARLGKPDDMIRIAARTLHFTVWPAESHHDSFAVLEIGEGQNRFLKCLDAVHESISMGHFVWSVKYIIADISAIPLVSGITISISARATAGRVGWNYLSACVWPDA